MPNVEDRRRLERLTRRLDELRAWRNAREVAIPDWQFTVDAETRRTLHPKDRWPVVPTSGGPVRFDAQTAIPAEWAGSPVELELWLGGEGIIRVQAGDTTIRSGLDPFHHAFPLTEGAKGGEAIHVQAEVMPKGMFGIHIYDPRLERAHLVIPHRAIRALERDLTMILDAAKELGEHEVVPHLLSVVEAAYDGLAATWPSNTDVVISRYVQGYEDTIGSGVNSVWGGYAAHAVDVNHPSGGIWSTPKPPFPLEPIEPAVIAAVEAVRADVAGRIAQVKEQYPPVGSLALTGHAHIDLAWLWPLAETHRKGRRTFASVLDLMDRYEDFTFNQSSAQLYTWIEEEDPELFAKVQQRVAEGRWEPIGGSWLEPDCMITGGEAFVRHLLYGQRYFESRFGKRSTVAWLPDVFGFSGGIPQLLRGAGLGGFFTIKLNWNETDRFPHDLFLWEGIDGTRVTANMFRNLDPAFGYNGNIAPLDTLGTWREFDGKRYHPESLLAFGWGDGGGGPSIRMLENYQRIKDFPALPRLHMSKIEDYFASLPADGIPTWAGELYLEFHRGTLTTQSRTKALNRAAETRLLEADAFAALAVPHGFQTQDEALEATWKTLLLNQFHDILPGSSINEVYLDNHRQMAEAVQTAILVRDAALRHLAGVVAGSNGGGLLIGNAGLHPRPLCVVITEREAEDTFGSAGSSTFPTQPVEDGVLLYDPTRAVPGIGWSVVTGENGKASSEIAPVRAAAHGDGFLIENDRLRVEIGTDGTLARVEDRTANREVLAGRGNQLWAFVDKPRVFDAWDIEEDYERQGTEITDVQSIEIVESGPLRAAVRVVKRWRDSTFTQTYRLLACSRRLDVATVIDWHERTTLVQARFPLAVHTREATYETMFGAVRRPTHRNTTWDKARFEVSGHRFADLSEAGYGVALLNDAKYGHGAHGNVLSLSLVRGTLYPDPLADLGEQRFSYALVPHRGDWTTAGVVQEAFSFNSPMAAVPVSPNPAADAPKGSLGTTWGFIQCEGLELALGSLKRPEDGDGLILRFYEPNGARGLATLRFPQAIKSAERVTLLEEHDPSILAEATEPIVSGDTLRLSVRPFEVISLRIIL